MCILNRPEHDDGQRPASALSLVEQLKALACLMPKHAQSLIIYTVIIIDYLTDRQ